MPPPQDLDTLLALKESDVSEMGVKVGHKRKLMCALGKLKARQGAGAH